MGSLNYFLLALYKYRHKISSTDTTSLSYYIILSIVPILSLMVISFSYLHYDVSLIESSLTRYFSNDLTEMIISYLTETKKNYFSLAAIVLSLVVSSRGIYHLKKAADNLYDVPKDSMSLVKHRLNAVLNTITFVFLATLLVIAFGIIPSLTIILDWLSLGMLSKYLVAFGIIFVLLLLINLIVPSIWPGFKAGASGSLVSSIGISCLIIFIRLFSNAATYDTIYGPLANMAALLIMLNWASHVIYFGICFSSVVYLENKKKEVDYENTINSQSNS